MLADVYFPQCVKDIVGEESCVHSLQSIFKDIEHLNVREACYLNSYYSIFGSRYVISENSNEYFKWTSAVYGCDLLWSENNYNNVIEIIDSPKYNDNILLIGKLFKSMDIIYHTTSSLIDELCIKNNDYLEIIFDKVFNYIWDNYIVMDLKPLDKIATELDKMLVYALFQQLNAEEGSVVRGLDLSYFITDIDRKNTKELDRRKDDLSSEKYKELFSEVMPMFPPYFVSYSKAIEAGVNIRDTIKSIQGIQPLYVDDKTFYHQQWIRASGGDLYGIFVKKPGVKLYAKTMCVLGDNDLDMLGITTNRPIEELNTRICYMHNKIENDSYIERRLEQNHTSILNVNKYEFIVSGASLSSLIEFTSRGLVANRMTTDKTMAQNNPHVNLI